VAAVVQRYILGQLTVTQSPFAAGIPRLYFIADAFGTQTWQVISPATVFFRVSQHPMEDVTRSQFLDCGDEEHLTHKVRRVQSIRLPYPCKWDTGSSNPLLLTSYSPSATSQHPVPWERVPSQALTAARRETWQG